MSNFAASYLRYTHHLEQINDGAVNCPQRMINEVEESYHDHLEGIARTVRRFHRGARLMMLSGPSSSGKTTTAHLLRDYLSRQGRKAHILSLDDFYKGAGAVPKLPDGTPDFETVEALEVEAVKACLRDLVTTGRAEVPVYDFAQSRPSGETRLLELEEDDMVVVEGIHALNPVFTRELPEESCVKLYVSVKQQIKDANGEVISPFDLRLVRRIVRDIQFRGTGAEETLAMWDSVVEGEDRYIRPYRHSADFTVNSIHIYEPCVLRRIAIPLLRAIAEDSLQFRKARDLESRLMRFEPVDAALVPANSMLREFIGRQGLEE